MTVLVDCIITAPSNGTVVYIPYPYNKYGYIAFKFNLHSKQHLQLLNMGYLFYTKTDALATTKAMHKAKCRAVNCITDKPSVSDILYFPILFDKKKNHELIIFNPENTKYIWMYHIGFLFKTSGDALVANVAMKEVAKKNLQEQKQRKANIV